MSFDYDEQVSKTQNANILEGGLDSKLTISAKSAMLNHGSWIEDFLRNSRSS
jgi:hypothetical protein